MTTAKVFKHRGSQAIRLPGEFHVKGKVVYLNKLREGFIVTEIDPWKICYQACQELSDDFMKARIQPTQQRRNQHRE
jgi:virulence-associated protein VagC